VHVEDTCITRGPPWTLVTVPRAGFATDFDAIRACARPSAAPRGHKRGHRVRCELGCHTGLLSSGWATLVGRSCGHAISQSHCSRCLVPATPGRSRQSGPVDHASGGLWKRISTSGDVCSLLQCALPIPSWSQSSSEEHVVHYSLIQPHGDARRVKLPWSHRQERGYGCTYGLSWMAEVKMRHGLTSQHGPKKSRCSA